jgi:hypothetical protein
MPSLRVVAQRRRLRWSLTGSAITPALARAGFQPMCDIWPRRWESRSAAGASRRMTRVSPPGSMASLVSETSTVTTCLAWARPRETRMACG